MADLEAVLADVSYLMAMEKSKQSPAARASKKIALADPRYVRQTQLYTQLNSETRFINCTADRGPRISCLKKDPRQKQRVNCTGTRTLIEEILARFRQAPFLKIRS